MTSHASTPTSDPGALLEKTSTFAAAATAVKVTQVLNAWALRRNRRTSRLFMVLQWSSVLLFLIGFGFYGACLYLGSSIWLVGRTVAQTRAIFVLRPILVDALTREPSGLDDPDMAQVVLDAADPSGFTRRRVLSALRDTLTSGGLLPSNTDGVTDCTQGHLPLCSHRITGAAGRFWQSIAAT